MATLQRWSYQITTERAALAALGEQGWELVSVQLVQNRETFYFKKPMPSLREEITLAQRDAALSRKKEGEEA